MDDARQPAGHERSDAVGALVIETTIDLIAEHGLAGFSMDELAGAAKVSKASIYKRWRSRAELVRDASRAAMDISIDDPDTGSVRHDLQSILVSLANALREPRFSSMVIAIVAEADRDEAIGSLGAALSREGRQMLIDVLARGVRRGELECSIDIEWTAQLLVAPLFYGRYFQQQPVSSAQIETLVERVLDLG